MATSDPLVEFLHSLADRDDRASLAALRGSLRPGQALDALRFVAPSLRGTARDGTPLSDAARRRQEDDAMLLAGLFALHPERGSLSLAAALRRVLRDTGSESVEGRFRALLSSGRSELQEHLRHAVSLCMSKGIAIDWADLHRTLRGWDADESQARRRWAQDFWASQDDADKTTPAT